MPMDVLPLSDAAALAAQTKDVVPNVDVSVLGLISKADIVVKIVMLMLLLASVISWAIIFDRFLLLSRFKTALKRFEEAFWSGQPIDDLFRRLESKADHPAARVFVETIREWKRCKSEHFKSSFIRDRVESIIGLTLNRELDQLEKRTPFLASVGSVAPFIGLFGTVWGIMNSFTAIANSQNTSLTVVAPGIAEALFATALGLVAAIPAVMAYNKILTEIGRYTNRVEAFAEELSGFLAKQDEERIVPA